jgi:hypothetical protein
MFTYLARAHLGYVREQIPLTKGRKFCVKFGGVDAKRYLSTQATGVDERPQVERLPTDGREQDHALATANLHEAVVLNVVVDRRRGAFWTQPHSRLAELVFS